MKAYTEKSQNKATPKEALEILKEGNKRFISGLGVKRNLLEQVTDTSLGQWPIAAILGCIDSRAPTSLVFDQGIGHVFSSRIAGNIINPDVLGGLEYSVKVAGSKIIVVMGHSKCGAVTSACKNVELGNITGLLSKIKPAIASVKNAGVKEENEEEFVEAVSHENVKESIRQILDGSEIIKELVDSGEVGIIGAYYDVSTGKVEFLEDEAHVV